MKLRFHRGAWWLVGGLLVVAHGDALVTAGLLASIAAHEAGHLAMARYFGAEVEEIGANWIGTYLRRAKAASKWAEALIALAGPLVNLLLALATSGTLAWFNWGMVAINLLPVRASDGYHAYSAARRMA